MEKEFCTYNQALALKELGFNEPCFRYNCLNISLFECFMKNPKHKESDCIVLVKNSELPSNNYTLPLYQQAFSFFREKHNIRVWTEWGSEYLCCAMIQYSSGMKECIDCCSNDKEAEQACLNKLIEICKNK